MLVFSFYLTASIHFFDLLAAFCLWLHFSLLRRRCRTTPVHTTCRAVVVVIVFLFDDRQYYKQRIVGCVLWRQSARR
jgi:hypothetical protein